MVLKYLERNFDYARFGVAEDSQLPAPGVDSWLRPAWNVLLGSQVVRGTRIAFPGDGPITRYAALFDDRPMFDVLCVSFLCAVLGEHCSDLEDLCASLLERPE